MSDDKLAVLLDMMNYRAEARRRRPIAYDEGYLYPGPAVKNVPLSHGARRRARTSSTNSAGPNTPSLIANNPIELPLTPDKMVLAFRRWDEQIGSKKGK